MYILVSELSLDSGLRGFNGALHLLTEAASQFRQIKWVESFGRDGRTKDPLTPWPCAESTTTVSLPICRQCVQAIQK